MAATTTVNMQLTIPAVGDAGTTYAENVNDSLERIDTHDHSSSLGVRITPAGININSTLEFGNNAATDLSRTQYTETAALLTGAAYANSVHFFDDEAYIVDGTGNSIQLTAEGYLNVTTSGGWVGLASPASARYSGVTKVFSLFQDTSANQAGLLDIGDIKIRSTTAGDAVYTTIQRSASQASNHTVTLWASLPASTSVVTLTSAGVLASTRSPTVDTLTVTGDLTVQDDIIVTDDITAGGTVNAGSLDISGDGAVDGVLTVGDTLDVSGGEISLPNNTNTSHGNRLLHIPAFTGFEGTGGGTFEADGTWQSNGASDTITIPVILHRGDRITSIDIDGSFGGTGARTRTLLNAAGSDIWTSSASVASGSTTITLTGSAHTLAQHEYLVIRFSSLSSNDSVQGITVTYDRP